jgi:hypothetical protein
MRDHDRRSARSSDAVKHAASRDHGSDAIAFVIATARVMAVVADIHY